VFDICLLLHVQSLTPDDGRKDRPKHVECHSKKNKFDTFVHLVGFTVEEVDKWHYVIEGHFRSMKLFGCLSHFNQGRT
jgi:hypothetical protein